MNQLNYNTRPSNSGKSPQNLNSHSMSGSAEVLQSIRATTETFEA